MTRQYAQLITAKSITMMVLARYVLNLIMWLMASACTKAHVQIIIPQQVNVETVDRVIIWYQDHVFLKIVQLTVQLMSVNVWNVHEDSNLLKIKHANLNTVHIQTKITHVPNASLDITLTLKLIYVS